MKEQTPPSNMHLQKLSSQEIATILWDPETHWHFQSNLYLAHVSQLNPVHTLPSCSKKIHFTCSKALNIVSIILCWQWHTHPLSCADSDIHIHYLVLTMTYTSIDILVLINFSRCHSDEVTLECVMEQALVYCFMYKNCFLTKQLCFPLCMCVRARTCTCVCPHACVYAKLWHNLHKWWTVHGWTLQSVL